MSDLKDFEIENGALKRYVGGGGEVTIPDSVTSIGWDAFPATTDGAWLSAKKTNSTKE